MSKELSFKSFNVLIQFDGNGNIDTELQINVYLHNKEESPFRTDEWKGITE